MSPTFELIVLKLSYVERVLLREFKFTDATSHSVLPLALIEVTVGPAVDSNAIWLILVVVAKVHALVWINIPAKACFLVAFPIAFVLASVAGPCVATKAFLVCLRVEPANILISTFP